MSGEYVLDTNIVIDFIVGVPSVKESVLAAEEIIVPAVVIGELFHGAYRSARRARNIERVTEFASSHTVVAIDTEVAPYYGQIKTQLRQAGTPIPDNDIWIAAVAVRTGTTLVTRDSHFQFVEGLTVEL
jgi:tRNA(fMet)-specific endonuclease VapC